MAARRPGAVEIVNARSGRSGGPDCARIAGLVVVGARPGVAAKPTVARLAARPAVAALAGIAIEQGCPNDRDAAPVENAANPGAAAAALAAVAAVAAGSARPAHTALAAVPAGAAIAAVATVPRQKSTAESFRIEAALVQDSPDPGCAVGARAAVAAGAAVASLGDIVGPLPTYAAGAARAPFGAGSAAGALPKR